jgi:preprotein translocase subunit SecG
MDAIHYYFTIMLVWIPVILAVVFNVLMFHYNGAIVFRWVTIAMYAIAASVFFVNAQTYSELRSYYYLAIVFIALAIVMAFVRTDTKHETQNEDVGTPDYLDKYAQRMEKYNSRIRKIRGMGNKRPPQY